MDSGHLGEGDYGLSAKNCRGRMSEFCLVFYSPALPLRPLTYSMEEIESRRKTAVIPGFFQTQIQSFVVFAF